MIYTGISTIEWDKLSLTHQSNFQTSCNPNLATSFVVHSIPALTACLNLHWPTLHYATYQTIMISLSWG